MAHSDNADLSTEPELDIEPIVGRAKTFKFRNIKGQPRWKFLSRRRNSYEDYANTCELLGDVPDSPHSQCHLSAAKLKGSPEYAEKVAKMSERRAHVRTHEPEILRTNVRWCGCSTEYAAPENTLCCWCAEYGAPDMKLIPLNKWGSKYANSWTQGVKRRKVRPHDKPCAPLIVPHEFQREYNDEYINVIIYNIIENTFYDFYP